MICSPSEPQDLVSDLGAATSLAPEDYGVDVLFALSSSHFSGLVGVQRKAFPDDLLSSLDDGRLARQVPLMRQLDLAMVILEGRADWTSDGTLVHGFRKKFTRSRLRGIIWSLQYNEGIGVTWTQSVSDTAQTILNWRDWLSRPASSFGSLNIRSKRAGKWGRAGRESVSPEPEHLEHFLEGLPGISRGRARMILSHFGRIPMDLTDDLRDVEGVGKITAERVGSFLSAKYVTIEERG